MARGWWLWSLTAAHAFRFGVDMGGPVDTAASPPLCAYERTHAPISCAWYPQERDDGERYAVAAEILGLLADRTRLALLHALTEGEADVTTLTEACGAARPSVSQHLARLRLAGLVTTRKEGRRVIYSLRTRPPQTAGRRSARSADHQLGDLPPHD